ARSTAAVDVTIAFNSSAALLDRNSCQNLNKVLSRIIVRRTIMVLKERSSGSAKMTSEKRETTLTANSTPLNGVMNAWKSCWYQAGGLSWEPSFAQYAPRRASTACSVSPLLLACRRANASSGAHAQSSGSGEVVRLLVVSEKFVRLAICLFMTPLRLTSA